MEDTSYSGSAHRRRDLFYRLTDNYLFENPAASSRICNKKQ